MISILLSAVLRIVFIFIPPLLLPYILALTWLYTAHIVRQAFHCPKWLAGLVAVVFSNPFIFLVCALKLKNRRALAALAIFAGMIITGFTVLRLPEFGSQTILLQILVIAMTGAYVAVVAALPDKQHTPKWAYAPVLIHVASLFVLSAIGANLERRANCLNVEVARLAGVKWTEEDAIAFYTNGIPMTTEPYATLFNSEVFENFRIKDYQEPTARSVVTKEGIKLFNEFIVTNATILAQLDAATEATYLHLAQNHLPSHENLISYFSTLSGTVNWGRFYKLKLDVAAKEGDMKTVLDCLRRLKNIRTWYETSNTPLDGLLAGIFNSFMIHGINSSILQLPDEILPELQNDLQSYNNGVVEKIRFNLMHQQIIFNKSLRFFEAVLTNKSKAKFIPCFPQMIVIWRNCERLFWAEYHRQLILLLEQDAPNLYGVISEFENKIDGTIPLLPVFRTSPLSCVTLNLAKKDTHATAFTGIAVERYRRKHSTLPESLDALIPDFLDNIPLSIFNGEPLMYRTGEFEVPLVYEKIFTNIGYQVYGPVYRKISGAYEHFTVSFETNFNERAISEILDE